MLDNLGYATVPIASSNIWRYRGYKDAFRYFCAVLQVNKKLKQLNQITTETAKP